MADNNYKIILKAVIPLIIAFLSVSVISKYATSAEYHAETIEALDDKKNTVLELTAAATAASVAITLIPGDAGTPVAEKLADLNMYFLIVLCAIYLEKYLLTTVGYASFVILIPLACGLFCLNAFLRKKVCTVVAVNMLVFSLALAAVIPTSVKVSSMIESTYQSSLTETIESAEQAAKEIEKSGNAAAAEGEEKEGLFSGAISKIKEGVAGVSVKFENILNNFIEALAVMLVTACIIPVVVLLFFIWLVKTFLGAAIKMQSSDGGNP